MGYARGSGEPGPVSHDHQAFGFEVRLDTRTREVEMEKQVDGNLGNFMHRRIAQIKVSTRVLEHELDAAKGNDVTLDRDLLGSMLDVLEIYVEDFTRARGGTVQERGRKTTDDKPAVTRLN
jgi:hypothetical protein